MIPKYFTDDQAASDQTISLLPLELATRNDTKDRKIIIKSSSVSEQE